MFSSVLSACVYGVESRLVHVEADVGDGLPQFSMVGDLSAQVREAQERVRSALRNSGRSLRPKRITINLSPADLRKHGSGFDLAIAIAVAAGYGEIPAERLSQTLIIGELSLNGEVRKISGVLPIVADAADYHCHTCILPYENLSEVQRIQTVRTFGVRTLEEAISCLRGEMPDLPGPPAPPAASVSSPAVDFSEIRGQSFVRRAAEVAVAGGHNLLMIGPPGAGKSMIAQRIATILPPLSLQEQMEVSRIYSAAGLLLPEDFLLYNRPYRSPHHTITAKALSGGGLIPKPGELSLAHNGVLFLDELPEFRREVLEILRQPLEEGKISISRVGGTFDFPTEIMLVAAMNPCPCGYYPNMKRCSCTYSAIQRYQSRISAPLLDRIDITAEVEVPDFSLLFTEKKEESSAVIRKRIMNARALQQERYQGQSIRCNARLTSENIEKYCRLGSKESAVIEEAFRSLELSVRGCHRILKVARTIADLDGREQISVNDLQEALCYRGIHRRLL
ncbi:MAG: YifB family Mg chelatase-like AAA ATPase [Eubacteriales bacterium]|nr:YifB family Mg chelatase-like AAA ATPase [Eubacteriales bacterium]